MKKTLMCICFFSILLFLLYNVRLIYEFVKIQKPKPALKYSMSCSGFFEISQRGCKVGRISQMNNSKSIVSFFPTLDTITRFQLDNDSIKGFNKLLEGDKKDERGYLWTIGITDTSHGFEIPYYVSCVDSQGCFRCEYR